jgi:hypothetical protein
MRHPIGQDGEMAHLRPYTPIAPTTAQHILRLLDRVREEPEPWRPRTMVDRFGSKTPIYRALSQEGDTWGTIVSAFWGAGVKLTNPEFWARGYVEAVGPEHYRITRKGLRALWTS